MVITLTTDFGLTDSYVGVMKGVILGIEPTATVVDLCHGIRPQDVAEAAFVLGTAWNYFPADTIHVAVVDPGVGGPRRGIALRTAAATFVGPDNGIFSYVLAEAGVSVSQSGLRAIAPVALAVELSEPRYWLPGPSATFHGRDIFAPVAAHLAAGVPLVALGSAVDEIQLLPVTRPERRSDGSLAGHVLHVDQFGNLITDIRRSDLVGLTDPCFTIRGRRIRGLRRYYAEAPGLCALVGSSGRVEIALRGGSAAAELGADTGEPVTSAEC